MIRTFKGFDKNLCCRDMQYEIGKSYEEPDAEVCNKGFHACERPLDVFKYYPPATSRYCMTEQSGKISKASDDTKVSSTKIKIGAEIGIPGLVKAQIEWTKAHTTNEHTDPDRATAGEYGAATAGNCGAATAGNCGAATAGEYGAATAGYCGAATAGDSGAATAGYCGAATAGNCGAATAGDSGAATAGYCGAATAGEYGAATAGNCGAATAGYCGAATSKGSAAVGAYGLAVARGCGVKVRGGLGAILVIAEENTEDYNIENWMAVQVDGVGVKADTWYKLNKDGQLEEVQNA